MKTTKLLKGVVTVLVLFTGLTLNATLGSIAVTGFITSDEGENLSEVTVRCSSNPNVQQTTSTGTGLYFISGLQDSDVLVYSKDGFNSETRTVSESSGLSQQIDVEMSHLSSSH